MQIPVGAVLTYQAIVTTDEDLQTLVNDIASALSAAGISISDEGGNMSTSNGLLAAMFISAPANLTLQLTATQAFSSETDVQSIVDAAIANETGTLPQSTIPTVNGTTVGVSQTSAVPLGTGVQGSPIPNSITSLITNLLNAGNNAAKSASFLTALIPLLILGIIALLIFSPEARKTGARAISLAA